MNEAELFHAYRNTTKDRRRIRCSVGECPTMILTAAEASWMVICEFHRRTIDAGGRSQREADAPLAEGIDAVG